MSRSAWLAILCLVGAALWLEAATPRTAAAQAQSASAPEIFLTRFTYEAAANAAHWDRAALECVSGKQGVPRAVS